MLCFIIQVNVIISTNHNLNGKYCTPQVSEFKCAIVIVQLCPHLYAEVHPTYDPSRNQRNHSVHKSSSLLH